MSRCRNRTLPESADNHGATRLHHVRGGHPGLRRLSGKPQQTHVDDIVSHIDSEELTDVVLVGHSYAGFPASLAATRRPDAVSHLVLLDSFFPREGETLLGHLGPDFANDFNAKAAADLC